MEQSGKKGDGFFGHSLLYITKVNFVFFFCVFRGIFFVKQGKGEFLC